MQDVKVDKLIELLKNKNNAKAYKIANMLHTKYIDSNNKCSDFKLLCTLYTYFLSLVDRKTRYRLRVIDLRIKIVTDYIKSKTGWKIGRNQGILHDNIVIAKDPEFNSYTTHRIIRDYSTNGYVNFVSRDRIAFDFVANYKYELDSLHSLYVLKENIMSGEYILNDPLDSELCICLSDYLGFGKNDSVKKLTMEE